MNSRTKKRCIWLALCALSLFGCATDRIPEPVDSIAAMHAGREAPRALAAATGTDKVPPAVAPGKGDGRAGGERIAPTIIKGSDVMVGSPSSRSMVSRKGEAVSLRFEQAPVTEVVHAIFGDLLKIDYALVTPLSGDITLHTHAPIARDQVLGIIESLLQANGIAMVQDVSGRYRIGKAEALKGAVPLPHRTEALPSGFGSVVVPLQYIGAAEMADILKPVSTESSLLRVDTVRNLLMLAGTRNQIEGWLEIINTFDVDFLKGLSVGLFPLTYTSVKDVESALKALLGTASASAGTPGQSSAAPTPPTGVRAGGESRSGETTIQMPNPLAGIIRVLSIERLNALLVITARSHYLDQARTWIERFDRPTESDAEPRLFVYPVQNGSAQHLAGLLNGLYGNRTSGAGTARDSGVAPTQGTTGRTYDAFGAAGGLNSLSMLGGGSPLGATRGFGGTGALGTAMQGSGPAMTQVDLGPDIRVVADDHNNALLIHASGKEYRRLEAALRRLDVAPIQVLIEASIIEVTLSDELKYGLQWYFQGSLGNGWRGLGQLTSGTTDAIGTTNPGFSYSILNPDGAVRAVLNALAKKSLLNVISSPSVMVLDNHTAAIQVGDQQPVQSMQTVTDGGNTTTSIQYKDTGVMLAVTPSVNAGDMVSMVVNQMVTDVGAVDDATGQRSFLQRQISSRVAVRSGETIVLGGLIRDNKTRGKQGLPLLHEIPVLGNLFGATSIESDRTELLVMITPRVVRTEQDVRDVGVEIRERMRGLKGLLDSSGVPGRRSALPDGPLAVTPAPGGEGTTTHE